MGVILEHEECEAHLKMLLNRKVWVQVQNSPAVDLAGGWVVAEVAKMDERGGLVVVVHSEYSNGAEGSERVVRQ